MQIGEVVERTGLTHRTLRYYEEIGLLKPPTRMEGGFRLYSEEDIQHINNIREMVGLLGFHLAEIREMVAADEIREQIKAEYRQGSLSTEEKIQKLKRAMEVTEYQAAMINQKHEQLGQMRVRWQQKLEHFQSVLGDLERSKTEAG